MATSQIKRQSLHEALVAPPRDMILRGGLRAGDRMPEGMLCERFGVSRTPSREALKVLAAEGVLQIVPHRGTVVAGITEDRHHRGRDQRGIPIMAALEHLARTLACAGATDADVARIPAGSETRWRRSTGWADRPGFDLMVRAMSGAMSVTGHPGMTLVRTGVPVVDTSAAPCSPPTPSSAPASAAAGPARANTSTPRCSTRPWPSRPGSGPS